MYRNVLILVLIFLYTLYAIRYTLIEIVKMKKNYGLIGYPVKHSFSPEMHNAAFKHLGIDAEYRLFEVKPEELRDFFAHFKERLSGINITIPHKESAVEYMDDLEPVAKSIGAINTVSVENGRLLGHNTDVAGFLGSVNQDLKLDLVSRRAIVFGAGGASRAVTFGLFIKDIRQIILVDIDGEKAARLASELKDAGYDAIAVEYDKKAIKELVLNSDLLVNATPCGMKENDPELLPKDFLHENLAVFDLIYNPAQTKLIEYAKSKGLKATNGLGMLLRQGTVSFEIWTKKKAPIEVMREALIKALNEKT